MCVCVCVRAQQREEVGREREFRDCIGLLLLTVELIVYRITIGLLLLIVELIVYYELFSTFPRDRAFLRDEARALTSLKPLPVLHVGSMEYVVPLRSAFTALLRAMAAPFARKGLVLVEEPLVREPGAALRVPRLQSGRGEEAVNLWPVPSAAVMVA